jgi:hypothetical protein
MCDIYPGQLILCFPKIDDAGKRLVGQIKEREIEHVSYVESIDEKLARAELRASPDIEFELHLVEVPPGQESWKITYLQFFWKLAFLQSDPDSPNPMKTLERSDFQFTAAPNHVLTLANAPPANPAVSAQSFRFGPLHQAYKGMMGLPGVSGRPQETVRVLVLDSGLAADAKVNVVMQRNLVTYAQPYTAPDDNGHGTIVTLMIHDVAPGAEFVIFKVADATGRISEWDALAGMIAVSDAHVVNMSIQFGLPDKPGGCPLCGRESQASRSAVFENIVGQYARRTPRPVIVAAAGNWGGAELGFPARFGDVIAVGAITSQYELASDSNYGDYDQTGSAKHDNHFVAPGGDLAKGEAVVTSSSKSYAGSSFGAAFASGLITDMIARQGVANYDYDKLVQALRQNAISKLLKNYASQYYGHGVLQA